MTSPLPASQAHSSMSAHLHVSVFTLTRCLFIPPSVGGVPQFTDVSILMEGKAKILLIQPLNVTTHSLKSHAGGGPVHRAHT